LRLTAVQEGPVIGRERERELVRLAVARARDGGAVFLLVVGEPGIGKSTLLSALSDMARRSGLTVGSGRGQPEGAVPLWSWCSAFASIASARGHPSDGFGPPGNLCGERDPGLEGRVERFAFFEQFTHRLSLCAAEGPIALVLDDLHWSDISALRLFRHLLDHPSMPGVLIAAALRSTEPLSFDASELVSELLAHPLTEVVEVSGFDAGEIAAFAAQASSRRWSDADIGVLARRSGGNPFLLGELLRWVPTDGSAAELEAALPLAVRESVRRRLVVEDEVTQHVVKAAAVAGAAASLDLLTRISGVACVDVGMALDSAVRAGLLTVVADKRRSVCFVHDLVREAVLSMLPTWDRIELHHAVGTALHDNVRSSSWAAVTAHLTLARSLVDDVTLAAVARNAAAEAARAGAFDEAADHLSVALQLTEPAGDTPQRGELLVQRGGALWAAERAEESMAALSEAAELARRTDDWELLARVALSWRGGELRAIMRHPDHQFLALLREALTACASDDSRLRCLLLARWARCAYWDIGDADGLAAVDEAVAMARRLADPEALTSALGHSSLVSASPSPTRCSPRRRPPVTQDSSRTRAISGSSPSSTTGGYATPGPSSRGLITP
jgi:predicted ATPase